MRHYSEIYVPNGWIKTTEEIPENPTRSSWPEIEGVESNVFDLSIVVNEKTNPDPMKIKEQLILSYTYGNNEVSLVQETGLVKRKSIVDDELDLGGREYSYLLKVINHETNASMYYDVKLARVEMEKKEKIEPEDNSLTEHIEVIVPIDEEENPFETDFENIGNSED